MSLVAYRAEYLIRVDVEHNRVLFERLEELTLAADAPYYLSDWQRALAYLKPGFTVLYDARRTLGPNVRLLPTYMRLHELWLAAGIGIMAEVHSTTATMHQISRAVREQSKVPTQLFMDRAEAEAFLERYRLALEA